MRLDERDYEWFEVWHHWGAGSPLALSVVCKFRDDDAIVCFYLPDGKVHVRSEDYSVIRSELEEDEHTMVQGREVNIELAKE